MGGRWDENMKIARGIFEGLLFSVHFLSNIKGASIHLSFLAAFSKEAELFLWSADVTLTLGHSP
jgi:hypothetical protein